MVLCEGGEVGKARSQLRSSGWSADETMGDNGSLGLRNAEFSSDQLEQG